MPAPSHPARPHILAARPEISPAALAIFLCALLLASLTGCAQPPYGGAHYSGGMNYAEISGEAPAYAPTHYYPPPGPPSDPWGPYIQEAASRFSIPGQWIRAVMAQESGGQEQAVSSAGAMGLMQLMPATYQTLESQYGLGADPFNPEDNILAGSAYIRQMYDRYGAPGFLAAYNAGPQNLDNYLAGQGPLPDETVNYLASITPNLGNSVPMSGPLANYAVASAANISAPSIVSFATGCDVNAAYDPDHPCAPVTGAAAGTAAMQLANAAPSTYPASPASAANAGSCDLNSSYDPDSPCDADASGSGACNLNTAYDPSSPCTPASMNASTVTPEAAPLPAPTAYAAAASPAVPPQDSSSLYQPASPPPVQPPAAPAATQPQMAAAYSPPDNNAAAGAWAIQVGAFSSEGLARTVAAGAQAQLSGLLSTAAIETPPTAPFGGMKLYRARLVHLSRQGAVNACSQLNARQLPCIVVMASAA